MPGAALAAGGTAKTDRKLCLRAAHFPVQLVTLSWSVCVSVDIFQMSSVGPALCHGEQDAPEAEVVGLDFTGAMGLVLVL